MYDLGLVYWGLTPQQQPGAHQGSELMYDLWLRVTQPLTIKPSLVY